MLCKIDKHQVAPRTVNIKVAPLIFYCNHLVLLIKVFTVSFLAFVFSGFLLLGESGTWSLNLVVGRGKIHVVIQGIPLPITSHFICILFAE